MCFAFAGRHCEVHAALLASCVIPFSLLKPAYPLELDRDWTADGLLCHRCAGRGLACGRMDEVAARSRPACHDPIIEGRIYELCSPGAPVSGTCR